MNLRNVFYASLIVLAGSLAACFGGGGSSSADDSAQVAALQQTVTALQATVAGLTTSVTTMQKNQAADEKAISIESLQGHLPGAKTTAENTGSVRTYALARAVDTTDYGICPDMGQWAGHGPTDIDGSVTDYFKQCTGNKYLVNSSTGKIAHSPDTWYASTDCSGPPIMFVSTVSFDRPTVQGGIVFASLFDNTVWWVQPSTGTPSNMTANSQSSGSGVCSPDNETHPGYQAVANVTDGNSGSGAPSGGVPNTYAYN